VMLMRLFILTPPSTPLDHQGAPAARGLRGFTGGAP
jgi:hypothetical protein